MRKIILPLAIAIAIAGTAQAQDKQHGAPAKPAPAAPAPPPAPGQDPDAGEFKFKDSAETHNFGEIVEGPMAECDFIFTNVGKKPIVITEAHGSCGCTVPQWPKDSIMPAKKGFLGRRKKPKEYKIHVTYNTNGRQGAIMKDVIINSNAKQQPMVLHIRGFVKPKPVETPAPPPNPKG
jgi:Protein of unknown function (DUF1573)